MSAPPRSGSTTLRLSRRRLLTVGGAGAAALWLAPMGGVAEAATLEPALRRSSWTALGDPLVVASRDGRDAVLRLTAVSDLPVASKIQALRGHDAAFVLRFSGPAGLPAGLYRLQNAEVGAFDLSLGALADDGRYAAIVDRTVRVAGVNDDGEPVGVSVPSARAAQPEARAAASGSTAAGAPRSASAADRTRLRLHRLRLRVAPGRRTVEAELAVADLRGTRTVAVLLLRRGRLVARGHGAVRAGRPLRVRLGASRALSRGRHELVVALVDGEGRTTRIRRAVRLG